MSVARQRFMSAGECLAWEERQAEREYLRGEVYEARATHKARDAHVTVALNLAMLLKSHLRGTPCRTYVADMKLRVETADAYSYPDVFVGRAARYANSGLRKPHPVLVVEVLSGPTAAYDRGGKFAGYRLLDDLEGYVLIDPDARAVDIFRRDGGGRRVLYPHAGDAEAEFTSLEFRAPLSLISEGVAPPAA